MKADKKGFTLIELLVVIGIIGVLSAVMIGALGGSSNAAKATQCMTNLRGLSVAVLNQVMSDTDGNFPPAGSLKYKNLALRNSYVTRRGWLSWDTGDSAGSPSCPSYITFSDANKDKLRYAITNGCIWATGGKTEKIYRCPTHEAACLKANGGRMPGWSYVMNESFHWNSEGKAFRTWQGVSQGGLSALDAMDGNKRKGRTPSKVLLFAEIQGITDSKRGLVANTNGSGDRGDGVLQYKKDLELIGFNHEQSGGKLAAHVAFADGHVEKLMYPSNKDVKTLTKLLCSGREVAFNGSEYKDISEK